MWTQINCLEVSSRIKPESIIATDPDKPATMCVVKKITPHYIKAIHRQKLVFVIITPYTEIVSGKWWLLE